MLYDVVVNQSFTVVASDDTVRSGVGRITSVCPLSPYNGKSRNGNQSLLAHDEETHVSSIPAWRNLSLALSTLCVLGVGGDTIFCKPDPGSPTDVFIFSFSTWEAGICEDRERQAQGLMPGVQMWLSVSGPGTPGYLSVCSPTV